MTQTSRNAVPAAKVIAAPSDPSPMALRLAAFAAVAGFAVLALRSQSICDDAYISFRYLDNWIAGHGLVFNPGHRVEGYTNFLWIVLMAPLRLLGLTPELSSLVLSAAAVVLLLFSVHRLAHLMSPAGGTGWIAVILVSGSLPVAYWAGSGMETVLFASLIVLANERIAAAGRHCPTSSVAFGLATLTRPSGVIFAMAAFAFEALAPAKDRRGRLAALVVPGVIYAVFPAGHLVFRLAYYGSPLPNTFYTKLGGEMPNLVPAGLGYLFGYVGSGGIVLLVLAIASFAVLSGGRRLAVGMTVQIALHALYVVRVGGDYFPFHRFLVPVIPLLAVLGAIGLCTICGRGGSRVGALTPVAAIALSIVQIAMAARSPQARAASALETTREERERVAIWVADRFGPDTTLAINAAGLIPYRTGFVTIDMLGLNDPHIARSGNPASASGHRFVGHLKHDGAYVCRLRPDLVLTSGARLHSGRDATEAAAQASLNTFVSDREFLSDPNCRDTYREIVEELEPGRFVVGFIPGSRSSASDISDEPISAQQWFDRGVRLMRTAQLADAAAAFRRSLELAPNHPVALTNLGFCLLDLHRPDEALKLFEFALEVNPDEFDALYGIALAHKATDRPEAAAAALRNYIAEAPASIWTEKAAELLYQLEGARR